MTEVEWLTSDDLEEMLTFLREGASLRGLRHLMVAPVVLVLENLVDKSGRQVVEVLHSFANGEISRHEMDRLLTRRGNKCKTFTQFGYPWETMPPSLSVHGDVESAFVWFFRFFLPPDAIVFGESAVWQATRDSLPATRIRSMLERTVSFVRDIFGNPFRPVSLSSAWRSETAVALASGIYAERAFDRLPVLADALEEAGCDHADVLSHCRVPGPHVRGCWVVDLVLGKEWG